METTAQGLASLTPLLSSNEIAFSRYIVAIVCHVYVLLSETDSNGEGIEKVFNKNVWRVNHNL